MAPARRTGRKKTKNNIAPPRDSGGCEREEKQEEDQPKPIDGDGGDASRSECATPKAERYRIPELLSCPPAPKKRRAPHMHCSPCKASTSEPILFFNSPELELFFFSALRGMSAS